MAPQISSKFKVVKVPSDKNKPPLVDIVVVHGLLSPSGRSRRSNFKAWLLQILRLEEARISIFAFNTEELLRNGSSGLYQTSSILNNKVDRLHDFEKHTAHSIPNWRRHIIFLPYGLGGWVVQHCLATCNFLQTAYFTTAIIFLELRQLQQKPHWDRYVKSASTHIPINSATFKDIETDFRTLQDFLKKHGFDIQVEYHGSPSVLKFRENRRSHPKNLRSRLSTIGGVSSIDIDFKGIPVIKSTAVKDGDEYIVQSLKRMIQQNSRPKKVRSLPTYQSISNKSHSNRHLFDSGVREDTIAKGEIQNRSRRRQERPQSRLIQKRRDTRSMDDVSVVPPFQAAFLKEDDQSHIENRAESYHEKGELEQAMDLYCQILAIHTSPLIDSTRIRINVQTTIISLQQGKFETAELRFRDLEDQANEDKNKLQAWAIGRWLAVSMSMQGKYSLAESKLCSLKEKIDKIQRSREDAKIPEVNEELSAIERELALTYGRLGKYREAINLGSRLRNKQTEAVADEEKRLREDSPIGTKLDGRENENPERELQRARKRLATTMATLATIHNLRGDYKYASKINDEALQCLKEQLGPDHMKTLDSTCLRAELLAAVGNNDEAEKVCQKTLDSMRIRLGYDHPSTLGTLRVLVSIYTAQAQLVNAEQTASNLLAQNEGDLGKTHPQTLSCKSELAKIRLAQGDYDSAQRLLEEVIVGASDKSKRDRPNTLKYKSELAYVYCHLCNWDVALKLAYDILKEQNDIYSASNINTSVKGTSFTLDGGPSRSSGSDILPVLMDTLGITGSTEKSSIVFHPFVMLPLRCIALAEREKEMGNLEKAEEILRTIITIQESQLGKDHAACLAAKFDLGLTLRKQGDLNEALDLFKEILSHRHKLLGPDHPDTWAARHELSVTDCSLGRWENHNLKVQSEVLSFRSLILGDNHPDTIKSMLDISNIHQVWGNLDEAETLLLRSLAVPRLQPFHTSPLGVRAKADLAMLYTDQGKALTGAKREEKFHRAEQTQCEVIDFYKETLEAENTVLLQSMQDLALIYRIFGDEKSAECQYNEILDAIESTLTIEPPLQKKLRISVRSDLATLYFMAGRLEEAEEIQQNLVQLCIEAYGKENGETVTSMFNHALTLHEMKDERCLVLLQEVIDLANQVKSIDTGLFEDMKSTLEEWKLD